MPSRRTLDAGKAVITLSLQDKVTQSLSKLQTKLGKIGASFSRVGSFGIAGGGLGGLQKLFIGSAAGAALAWPVKLAANMQTARAVFETFTGSADEANRVLGDLEQFSTVSPYSTDVLQDATKTMLGFGVATAEVVPIVKSLGEIAGGDADKFSRLALAFGQTSAKTRLMAQEVLQMVEAGFNPLQEISRTTGEDMKALAKRMEAGGISADEVARAFESATSEGGRFHGMLDRMMETAGGQFSKAMGQIRLAVRPLGESVLPLITDMLKGFNAAIPGIAAFIKQNADLALTFAKVGGVVVLAASAFLTVGASIQLAAFAVGGIATAFTAATAVIGAILSPIGLAVAAVGGLTAAFLRFTETGQKVAASISSSFGQAFTVVSETVSAMASLLAAGQIEAAGGVMFAGLNVLWMQGTAALQGVWQSFLGTIASAWDSVWAGMLLGVNNVWGMVERGWSHTVEFFGSTIDNIGVWFADMWTDAVAALSSAVTEMMGFFKTLWQYVRQYSPFFDLGGDNSWVRDNIATATEQAVAEIKATAAEEKGNRGEAARIRAEERARQAAAARARSMQTDAGAAAVIGGDLNAGDAGRDARANAAASAAQKQLDAARAAWADARAAADSVKIAADKDIAKEVERLQPAIDAAGGVAAAGGSKAIATLDASFAAQQFGRQGKSEEVVAMERVEKAVQETKRAIVEWEPGIRGR